jgi:hypothetical protein
MGLRDSEPALDGAGKGGFGWQVKHLNKRSLDRIAIAQAGSAQHTG